MAECKFCKKYSRLTYCSEQCKISQKNKEWLENKPKKERAKPNSQRIDYAATKELPSWLTKFNHCRG